MKFIGALPIEVERPNGRQLVERSRDRLARGDEVGQQPLVDIEVTFVFRAITDVVTFGEHPPHLGTDTEGVRKNLEDDVSVRGAESRVAQRREA